MLGVTAGGVMALEAVIHFANKAALQAADIADDVDVILLLSHSTPGVGEPFPMKRIPMPAPVQPWQWQSADGAWWEINSAVPTTHMFGAVADGSNDDLAAIQDADAYAASRGVTLWFHGPHVASNGIDQTADWRGLGSPRLAPFPLSGDDKQFLRPGYKGRLPGSSIRFIGTGTQAVDTQRTDDFASFTYCVRTAANGLSLVGIGIILDTDVYDAGGARTAYGSENSASYDVGRVIDDASRCKTEDVDIFGYFPLAGTVIRSVAADNDDPDYNIFEGGSTMGRIGYAAIGSQTDDGQSGGLSGTQAYGWMIFTLDHHARSPSTAATIYANADSWRCIYIDGYTGATGAALNGHYFFGGCIRTYAIHPWEFDQASQVTFEGMVMETSNYAGVTNAATKQVLASIRTFHVTLRSCRVSNSFGLLGAAFGGTMKGVLTIDNCPGTGYGGGRITSEAEAGVANWSKLGGASGGTGDPAIQFGQDDGASSTSGWSIRRDISSANKLVFNYDNSLRFAVRADGGVQVPVFTVATLPSTDLTAGTLAYCSNGDAGAACLAVVSAGVWKRLAFGAAVSAT